MGQSLWALSNSVGTYYEKVNITQITYGWADERNDWDWNTMKCNDGKKCGHWQMVSSIIALTIITTSYKHPHHSWHHQHLQRNVLQVKCVCQSTSFLLYRWVYQSAWTSYFHSLRYYMYIGL